MDERTGRAACPTGGRGGIQGTRSHPSSAIEFDENARRADSASPELQQKLI